MQAPNVVTCSQLKGMLLAGNDWLKIHVDDVNALNVFPVPDGDTGTNMMLTMKAALAEVAGFSEEHVGLLASQVSRRALRGSRGNSGTILSQILQGFAQAIEDKAVISTREFAGALQSAADQAYQAVLMPVEGTILTIIRETAKSGQLLAKTTPNIDLFLSRILDEAKRTLQATPTLLTVLQEAGVVDSGGLGLVYILEGMARHVQGLPVSKWAAAGRSIKPHATLNDIHLKTLNNYYDVQFLIRGRRLNLDAIKKRINVIGESPLIVGDDNLIKVHVHVPDPSVPLKYGATQGTLLDVVVENMAIQSQAFLNEQQALTEISPRTAAICLVPSSRFAEIFASLGASVILYGDRSANPGLQDFLEAIKQVNAKNILILPNDKKLIPTAQRAGNLSKKQVRVVPTQTIPSGINAIISFNAEADLETNFSRMQQVAQGVHTLEISENSRPVTNSDISVHTGNIIASFDGEAVATGHDAEQVSLDALMTIQMDRFELLTIYHGPGISSETAKKLSQSIQTIHPNLEVEVVDGGQPYKPYIISLE